MSRRHTNCNVLSENIRTRFLDLVVGKGKTEIQLYDRIIYTWRDKVITQRLYSLDDS